jgi:hypothetical protein
MAADDPYGSIKGPYAQRSISARIEALFLDNLGKIVTREMIVKVATDPNTGKVPENWHQRLSELRTNKGYTILTYRDRSDLKVSEYLLLTAEKRDVAGKRVRPTLTTWSKVLARAGSACEWSEAGTACGLKEGEQDPVGGGTVRLTPDHKKPHSIHPNSDPGNPDAWQALCGRHQVMKKNYWDSFSGKLNVLAILQAATDREKRAAFDFLLGYFGAAGKLGVVGLLQSASESEKRDALEFLRNFFGAG